VRKQTCLTNIYVSQVANKTVSDTTKVSTFPLLQTKKPKEYEYDIRGRLRVRWWRSSSSSSFLSSTLWAAAHSRTTPTAYIVESFNINFVQPKIHALERHATVYLLTPNSLGRLWERSPLHPCTYPYSSLVWMYVNLTVSPEHSKLARRPCYSEIFLLSLGRSYLLLSRSE